MTEKKERKISRPPGMPKWLNEVAAAALAEGTAGWNVFIYRRETEEELGSVFVTGIPYPREAVDKACMISGHDGDDLEYITYPIPIDSMPPITRNNYVASFDQLQTMIKSWVAAGKPSGAPKGEGSLFPWHLKDEDGTPG